LSEPWWRRRKKKGPWFNDVYEELERLGDLIDETIQKAFETSSEKTPVHRTRVQGFSLKIGPDGKPRIQELSNRKPRQKKTEISEEPEPLVDLIEDAETLVVLASLPGVKRDAIDLRTTGNRLTISVDTPNLECHKELRLPAKVDPKSAHASYKNGVLEVKLKKIEHSFKEDKISVKK
jgi:HSP20 family protein